jgi:hypothetical protein
VAGIAVGGIHPDRQPPSPRVLCEIGPAKSEQRPDQRAAHGTHAREPCRPRTFERPHENRLRLIVRMMGGEDAGPAKSLAEREKPAIARFPGRGLSHRWSQVEPAHLAGETECGRERGHAIGDGGTLRVDPVVRVRHHQLSRVADRAVEQVEEDDGIEAARNGDECPAARQRQGNKVSAELVEEIHRCGKANRAHGTGGAERWSRQGRVRRRPAPRHPTAGHG